MPRENLQSAEHCLTKYLLLKPYAIFGQGCAALTYVLPLFKHSPLHHNDAPVVLIARPKLLKLLNAIHILYKLLIKSEILSPQRNYFLLVAGIPGSYYLDSLDEFVQRGPTSHLPATSEGTSHNSARPRGYDCHHPRTYNSIHSLAFFGLNLTRINDKFRTYKSITGAHTKRNTVPSQIPISRCSYLSSAHPRTKGCFAGRAVGEEAVVEEAVEAGTAAEVVVGEVVAVEAVGGLLEARLAEAPEPVHQSQSLGLQVVETLPLHMALVEGRSHQSPVASFSPDGLRAGVQEIRSSVRGKDSGLSTQNL